MAPILGQPPCLSAKCQPDPNPEHHAASDAVKYPHVRAFLQELIQGSSPAGVEDQAEEFDKQNDAEQQPQLWHERLLCIDKGRQQGDKKSPPLGVGNRGYKTLHGVARR